MKAICLAATLGTALIGSALVSASGGPAGARTGVLRVCADPNNLPFSNRAGEGFENRIAAIVARALGRDVVYTWWPQRRGFIRQTLRAGACDVVMGLPASSVSAGPVQTTRAYYRSRYVFVSRRDRHLALSSLDDPRLRRMRIGIQITGNDYDNPPPAQALAMRQLTENVRGFMVYGDYSTSAPQRDVVDAVADGRVDTAIVWGPVAGYFASRENVPLELTPLARADSESSLPFTFAIAIGVRRGDDRLREALDHALVARARDIRRVLRTYGVPWVPTPRGS